MAENVALIDMTLSKIQKELKAPKGQFNKFGNYKYRSCEDILEAVKPILAKYGATIIITDDIEVRGDRYYVRATAVLRVGDVVLGTTQAFAREPEEKRGMDSSQITGTASSYARKYALNGLLLIDDTKDEDSNELHEEKAAKEEQKATSRKTANKDKNPQAPEGEVKPEEEMTKPGDIITPAHVKAVRARIEKAAKNGKNLDEPALCKMLKINSFDEMNYGQLKWFNDMMEKNGV